MKSIYSEPIVEIKYFNVVDIMTGTSETDGGDFDSFDPPANNDGSSAFAD
ncbi:MAG: hypothetical protein LIO43_00365 [Clostridiales bacterium]|nr:hypothetical protein [Clostridiales bacterium]